MHVHRPPTDFFRFLAFRGSFENEQSIEKILIDASLIILFSVILISCTLIVVPFCISIYHLVYSFAVMGMAMGLVDITATISLIKKFKMDASPFIQALYCCYGIGAFCSPLILRFFVKDFDCTTLLEKSSNATGRRWIISHQMHRKFVRYTKCLL
uniref:Uncharacterized protein n=1 Tax=Romanomermis culicivorax TaxID=13658 RepID=A0A915HFY7_ROMCU